MYLWRRISMKEITVDAIVANVEAVTAFVDEQLEALDCSMKAQTQIDIAIDELFSNIAYYAYTPETGKATIRFESEENSDVVSISFIDSGVPYNPLEKEDPDITLGVEERQIGGLGIFMVKKSMDSIEYKYENCNNILTIKKTIR